MEGRSQGFVKAQWKGFDFAMLGFVQWKDEAKVLSKPNGRALTFAMLGFVQWKDEAKVTLPPLVGLPTIHCRRTLHVLPQSRGYNSNPFNNKSRPVHHSHFE